MAQSKKLIVICGPTATGKTKLGKALGGEVVSTDSMQVYRGMPIGTAQPTAEERDGVPHHMMAMADPSENYSVARYVEEATACVEDIFARGKQPILVGGTGLYIDALCKGQTFSDFQPDSGLRAKLQAQAAQGGLPRLWADLERIDPEAAYTPTTRSEFYGRWRCGTPPARPSPSTTGRPRPCRRGMRR